MVDTVSGEAEMVKSAGGTVTVTTVVRTTEPSVPVTVAV